MLKVSRKVWRHLSTSSEFLNICISSRKRLFAKYNCILKFYEILSKKEKLFAVDIEVFNQWLPNQKTSVASVANFRFSATGSNLPFLTKATSVV